MKSILLYILEAGNISGLPPYGFAGAETTTSLRGVTAAVAGGAGVFGRHELHIEVPILRKINSPINVTITINAVMDHRR
jgi:hypothetical protein